ncbi:MAG: hypothetical protein LBT59_07175 [Clostridiales bacterium]|nr:hypothetical protein [Clostridiales bacterium]
MQIDLNISTEQEKEAIDFYKEIRLCDTDVKAISKNTKLDEEKIKTIKEHIFKKFHLVKLGYKRFDPDYDMAVFWKRLIDGDVREKDLVFLELMYDEYVNVYVNGMTIWQAHKTVSRKFDYRRLND